MIGKLSLQKRLKLRSFNFQKVIFTNKYCAYGPLIRYVKINILENSINHKFMEKRLSIRQ